MTPRFRATPDLERSCWNVEECFNGTWFVITSCYEPDEFEILHTCGAFGSAQDRAERIVKALNA